jgi:hypothetical protein
MFSVLSCSDQLDQFYIERGFPAEREIGERETNESVVHNISTIGNTGHDLSVSPSPPPVQLADKGRHMVRYLPPPPLYTLPPPPRVYNTEAICLFSGLASNSEVVTIKSDIGQ